MRLLFLAALALAGCAAERPVTVAVPSLESGRLATAARVVDAVGDVQPIVVAMTNGQRDALRLDAMQVYAHDATGGRVAPIPPGEAARLAGGRALPGTVTGAAKGAASGGLMGAIGSAINGLVLGAVAGGVGVASAAGAAVGAVMGAISGASSAGATPDVAGFEDRALKTATLAPTFSASGYVYYPPADYGTLEILLTYEDGRVEPVTVPLTPEPD